MTLEQFVEDMRVHLTNFQTAYHVRHKENPDYYPLTLPDGNEELWLEFFVTYLQEGNV